VNVQCAGGCQPNEDGSLDDETEEADDIESDTYDRDRYMPSLLEVSVLLLLSMVPLVAGCSTKLGRIGDATNACTVGKLQYQAHISATRGALLRAMMMSFIVNDYCNLSQ